MIYRVFGLCSLLVVTGSLCSCMQLVTDARQPSSTIRQYAQTYADIAYFSYNDSYIAAVALQDAIDLFLHQPDTMTLFNARQAWLHSRVAYGQTEAYRFYEGPIDFARPETGQEGPEGQLNAWPLNEAYIDYVRGHETSGIVNQAGPAITAQWLIDRNTADGEADVTTGYHAIEFLLWGQDLSVDGPGARPASDYTPGINANDRRRQYLRVVTDVLVADLKALVDAWTPRRSDNYRAQFLRQAPAKQLADTMTGLATLSGFELASERIAVALDSGDPENEHSCFSDNTHNDILYNVRGIWNVYFGQYGRVDGRGLFDVIAINDIQLATTLGEVVSESLRLAYQIDTPVDRTLLSPTTSAARRNLEELVTSLQRQAKLFVEAGKVLGVDVIIAAE